MILTRLATAWALFQGLLIEALPFLLIGVLISAGARWFAPGGRWLRRLPSHPLLGPLTGAALGFALPGAGRRLRGEGRQVVSPVLIRLDAKGGIDDRDVLDPRVAGE